MVGFCVFQPVIGSVKGLPLMDRVYSGGTFHSLSGDTGLTIYQSICQSYLSPFAKEVEGLFSINFTGRWMFSASFRRETETVI